MRIRSAGTLAGAVVIVALVLPQPVSAVLVWSLIGTPVTATAGQATTFTLTATNADLLAELGCLEVELPSTFASVAAGGASASNGDPWDVRILSGPIVEVRSLSGGGRLESLDTVTFTFRATPTTAGATTWANHAHQREDCTGSNEVGVPLAITVDPQLLPTQTATPRPTQSPRPTPTPTPLLPLPSLPIPSLGITPTPTPSPSPAPTRAQASTATPAGSAGASPIVQPEPTGSAEVSPSGGASVTGGGSAGPGVSDPTALEPVRVEFEAGNLELGLGALDLIQGATTWAVPAATLAGPGLLLLLLVALQSIGALSWIPAVRRLRGDEEERA